MILQKYIPSLITLLNLLLGFVSIVKIYEGDYTLACYIVILAGVLDSIDGKLARKIGISNDFGKEIDSLADLVSFGLAPALLVYTLYTKQLPSFFGEIIASAPLLIGAIRLARFNIDDSTHLNNTFFIGLPIPINAISIISIVLFTENLKLECTNCFQNGYIVGIITLLSFLMISSIPYPKFPLLNFKQSKQNNYRLFGVILFVILLLISSFFSLSYLVIMAFTLYYLLLGIIMHLVNLLNVKTSNQEL